MPDFGWEEGDNFLGERTAEVKGVSEEWSD
jgi:hypothetical protein